MIKKLIDKDALVAEIERIKKEECPIDTYEGRIKLFYFERFLSFLNTLEVKEVNLDYKVDLDYIKKELDDVVRIYKPNGSFGWGTLYNIAKHFFELGSKLQKEE